MQYVLFLDQYVTPMALGTGCITKEVGLNHILDLREIKVRLNHDSSKTREIYTHVTNRFFMDIKDLLS